jgi:hypothetical protein
MKKTGLFMVLGLALVAASVAAPKANAGVVVGFGVGAPVYPVRAYGYVGPRYYAPGYVARPYIATGPYVVWAAAILSPRVCSARAGLLRSPRRAPVC